MVRLVSRLSIGRRLGATFAVLILLLVVLAGVSLSGLGQMSEARREVARQAALVEAVMQVKYRAADFNGWQTAYALDVATGPSDDPGAAVEGDSRASFVASAAAFEDELATATRLATDDGERRQLAAIGSTFEEFMSVDAQIVELYGTGLSMKVAQADKLVLVDEIELFQSISDQVDALVEDAHGALAAAGAAPEASAAQETATRTVLALAVVAALLAAALALVITRSLTGPIASLRGRLRQLAEGDLVTEVDSDGTDELAVMGRDLGRAIATMRTSVGAIHRHSVTLASAAGQLSASSQQIAAGAEETSVQAGVVSGAAEEVSRNVSTVAAGAEQMGASIREIAHSAN
ncbi:HAMP domain-containing protein, partial [Nocardioides flavescens]|uniref:HAMP domain-containing protein n=1 Tax=Nocardioides flavescens TaxID=2691959 RepID=UPI0019257ADB